MEHLIWRGLGKMASFLLPLLYFALAWRIGYGQQITDGKEYVKKKSGICTIGQWCILVNFTASKRY